MTASSLSRSRPLKRQSSEPPAGEPSSARHKADMCLDDESDDKAHKNMDKAVLNAADDAPSTHKATLETVLNGLDDVAHTRMDNAAFNLLNKLPFKPDPATIFATIVATSEGELDLTYMEPRNAFALLEEHPELMNKLEVAWNHRSFKEIRNLSV